MCVVYTLVYLCMLYVGVCVCYIPVCVCIPVCVLWDIAGILALIMEIRQGLCQ